MFAGTDTAYKLAKKYRIKTAFGTDILFDAAVRRDARRAARQAGALVHAGGNPEDGDGGRTPSCWRSRARATPIPGKLGVVEKDALADLLLVDGDPLEDLKLIADPEQNFVVIMKDGKMYKNTIR